MDLLQEPFLGDQDQAEMICLISLFFLLYAYRVGVTLGKSWNQDDVTSHGSGSDDSDNDVESDAQSCDDDERKWLMEVKRLRKKNLLIDVHFVIQRLILYPMWREHEHVLELGLCSHIVPGFVSNSSSFVLHRFRET
ncbi:hypothetical protein Tco_1188138 [Tanacetum coccineum]